MEKHVDFDCSASYCTLNGLTDKTTDIWIVCHGYGQLAGNFIRRFDIHDPDTTLVIALQGLSKFYMPNHLDVGASWMTKEDRETDLLNQKRYFDAVIANALDGRSLEEFNISLLGFSQGVSMITRMVVYRKISFNNMILWAGGFPVELTKLDFEHLSPRSQLKIVLGESDQFYAMDNYQQEIERMTEIIGLNPEIIRFDGKHEVKREVLEKLI